MNRNTIVAKRYAKALFEIAKERNIVLQVEEELRAIIALIQDVADFQKVLEHPNIDSSAKIKLIENALQGKVSDTVFNTIKLLIEKRRESILPELSESFVKIANEALGQANAIAYTPFALSDEEAAKLTERLGKLTGKTIRLENVVDKSLIGGMKVRIGDRLYDGSVAGKLERLEKTLNERQAM